MAGIISSSSILFSSKVSETFKIAGIYAKIDITVLLNFLSDNIQNNEISIKFVSILERGEQLIWIVSIFLVECC